MIMYFFLNDRLWEFFLLFRLVFSSMFPLNEFSHPYNTQRKGVKLTISPRLSYRAIPLDLSNVMNQAKGQPLGRDFRFPPQAESS